MSHLHRLMVLAAAAGAAPAGGASHVIPYPLAPGGAASGLFKVYVNDTEVPVEELPFGEKAHVASWAAAYPARVRVKALDGPIASCRVRPVRRGIKAEVKGDEAVFDLAGPEHLLLEVDGRPWLCLFADSHKDVDDTKPQGKVVQCIQPTSPAPGAMENPMGSNPIERAMDELSSQGGGTLVLPPGRYEATRLNIPTGVTLHLVAGALLDCANIVANKVERAGLTGQGVLWRAKGGGTMVLFNECRHSRIAGLRIHTQPNMAWTIIMAGDDSSITNVKMVNPCLNRVRANDGINVINSRRVTLDRFFYIGGDDAVSIKGYRRKFGDAGDGSVMRDIVFDNIVCVTSCGAAKIGSESGAKEIAHSVFRNMDVLDCGRVALIMLWDPVNVHDIRFENIFVERCRGRNRQRLIDFVMGDPERSRTNGGAVLEDIEVVNFVAQEASVRPSRIAGFSKERPVRNVMLRGVVIAGKPIATEKDADFEICFAENVRFVGPDGQVRVAASEDRPPVTGQYKPDVHGVPGGPAPGQQPLGREPAPAREKPPASPFDR